MILLILLSTLVLAVFMVFFFSAGEDSRDRIIECIKMDCVDEADKLATSMRHLLADMKRRDEMQDKRKLREGKALKKKYDAAMLKIDSLDQGKLELYNVIPIAGYGFIKLTKIDATNSIIEKMIKSCSRYREKDKAVKYSYYVLASLVGYLTLALAMFFGVLAITMAKEMEFTGVVVAIVAFAIFAIFGYIPLDSVIQTVAKRQEDIEKNFPQVISKLTLLTEAGIEVNKAWNLTSESGDGVLYMEMARVNRDLNNNVKPEAAYADFIQRCSNSYTSKMASLIIQNMFKGNSEMVRQLSELNTECWNEFRNNAQRMGEKISSKLLFPTLLMFAAVIILIIVPLLGSFGSI